MKTSLLFILTLILNPFVVAQTTVPAGNVSGIWTAANSPYNVTGAITIQNGETLTIEPGVTISFQGNFMFQVLGRILAVGTVSDSITFTSANVTEGWHGLRFINTSMTNDSSLFVYCKIQNGNTPPTGTGDTRYGGGIFIRGFSKVRISNCLFQNNRAGWGGAVSVRDNASILIENSTFRNNFATFSGSAIRLHDFSHATVRFNHIHNNTGDGGGTAIYGYRSDPFIYNNYIHNNTANGSGAAGNFENANPVFINNLIVNNTASNGGALYFAALVSSAKFINNTIANNIATTNGGGIYCNLSSTPDFINNIIWGNTAQFGTQVFINNDNSDPNFYNNIVQHGPIGFFGNGSQGNFHGAYINNVELNPHFLGTGNAPFDIPENSPAVDAGRIDTTGLNLLPFDFAMNNRINNNRIDIGAYENQFIIPVELVLFSANVSGNNVILNWSTASEINNLGFEIQKSEVGIQNSEFKVVGFVEGSGTTTEIKNYNFVDNNQLSGKYSYRLKQIDLDGSVEYSNSVEVEIGIPQDFALLQNYPNPFNPSTVVSYQLSVDSKVNLKIFDILGKEIVTLVNEVQTAGTYNYNFSTESFGNGKGLPSGVYYYKLTAGDFSDTKKMLLLK